LEEVGKMDEDTVVVLAAEVVVAAVVS